MPTLTVVVPGRFSGPPRCGNGGWVSGHLAQLVAAETVAVRLRRPVPVDTELEARAAEDTIELYDGTTLLAQAYPAERLVEPLPPPVPFDVAAAVEYEGEVLHPFPGCFVCGLRDDGLRLRTGAIHDIPPGAPGGRTLRAAAWRPAEVSPEIAWAALDCPGAWAGGVAGRPLVLGTMTGRLSRLPEPGEPHVVMAWSTGADGRKVFSGTALFDADGQLVGRAESTWLQVDPARLAR